MDTASKKKLCWNCEGNISLQDEVCPYCGVSVRPLSLEGAQSYQASHTSFQSVKSSSSIPPSPYSEFEEDIEPSQHESQAEAVASTPVDDPLNDFNTVTLTMFSLLSGAVFFIFGIILLLFAKNEYLTLSWNGTYWYLYLVIALPLLGYGWYKLQSIRE